MSADAKSRRSLVKLWKNGLSEVNFGVAFRRAADVEAGNELVAADAYALKVEIFNLAIRIVIGYNLIQSC